MNGLLGRFSPPEIERHAGEATTLDRLVPGSHKAKQWEVLLERYEDFSVEAKEDFWRAFELEFRRAYAAGQQSLDKAARKS